jgi:hypothetical protein
MVIFFAPCNKIVLISSYQSVIASMRQKKFIRLFLLILVASVSIICFSFVHSRAKVPVNDCSGNCSHPQSEVILLKSLIGSILNSR